MIVLFVAADIYGEKINLQLEDTALPTSLGALLVRIENVFRYECEVLRPPQAPLQEFGIERVQMFLDGVGWKDLVSTSQLQNRAQLYILQTNPNVAESQQKISRLSSRKPSLPAERREMSGKGSPRSQSPHSPATGHSSTAVRVAESTSSRRPSSSGAPQQQQQQQQRFAVQPTHNSGSGSAIGSPRSASPRVFTVPSSSTGGAASSDYHHLPSPTQPLNSSSQGGHGAAVLVPLSQKPVHPGDQASHSERVQYLFQVLLEASNRDLNIKHPGVTLDGLVRCLRENRFDSLLSYTGGGVFSSDEPGAQRRSTSASSSGASAAGGGGGGVIRTIFQRCDPRRSGWLNRDCVEALFASLPTLMESLYFRLLDEEDHKTLQQSYRSQVHHIEQLKERLHQLQHVERETMVVVRETEAQCRSLQTKREEIGKRVQQHHQSDAVDANEVQRVASERASLLLEVQHQSSALENTKVSINNLARRAEQASSAHRVTQSKLGAMEERVAELQRLLLAATRDVEAQREVVAHAAEEVQRCRSEEQAAQELERELHQGLLMRRNHVDELSSAMEQLQRRRGEAERALQTMQGEAEMMLRTQHAEHDRGQQAVLQLQQCRDESEHMVKQLSEEEQRSRGIDDRLCSFQQKRAGMEQREQPLLEEELRLWTQREILERQQGELRRNAETLYESPFGRT